MGPQYSSIRGSLAYGLLGGPASFGGMGGMGMGMGMGNPGMGMGMGMGNPGMTGLTGLSMLSGFGGGAGMPYGPFASYAQPGLLSGDYFRLGPYGRYPGSTGTTGYGSHEGYGVYNGYGSYSGLGGVGALGMGYGGDYDHYGTPWGVGSRDYIPTGAASQVVPGVRPGMPQGLESFGLAGPSGGAPSGNYPSNFRGDVSRLPSPTHFEGDGHGRMSGETKDSQTSASSSRGSIAA